MGGPIIVLVISIIILFLLFILGDKIKDEIKVVGSLLCVVAIIAGIVWFVNVKKERKRIYKENEFCLARIIALSVAVSVYNANKKDSINDLDEKIIKKLIEIKYLSSDFEMNLSWAKSSFGCEYTNQGDLETSEGKIVCKVHGDAKNIKSVMDKYN